MSKKHLPQHYLFAVYLAGVLVLSVVSLTLNLLPAISPVRIHASSLAEGFTTSSNPKTGMLVSTVADKPGELQLATVDNSDYLVGVVQTEGNGLISFTKDGANVSVATTGVVTAYVTDANGSVKKGDFIAASWLDGVGMRVNQGANQKVLGTALEDFNDSAAKEFDDVSTPGGNRTVKVGSLAVRLFGTPSKQLSADQSGISGFAARLVGKQVAFIRVVVAFLVFTITLIVSGIFIRSSIKNSFISIGRNPMASKSIYRSLLQVSVISMAIILIGTAAAYAVVVL